MKYTSFSNAVIEALAHYVYYLVDPRNNEIFYVGKGTGNRIFAHLALALDNSEKYTAKLDRIHSIHSENLTVEHVIHRHGLSSIVAYEVEASLIDFIGLEDLTNLVGGHHSHSYGSMTIEDAFIKYDAVPVEVEEVSVLLNVKQLFNPSMLAEEIYEITRGNWIMGQNREKVEYAFAVFNGIIRQIYRVDSWKPVQIARNGEKYKRIRWRFTGVVASELHNKYLHKDASQYVGQNPVRYVNVD